MDVMNSPDKCMEKLIEALKADHPGLTFIVGAHLCWSPGKQEIYYEPSGQVETIYGVLHEISHARLGHSTYHTDIDLLNKEVLAWEEALGLAKKYGIELDETHVQDCLDTYRDWLHKRSTCPACGVKGLQSTALQYDCPNCGQMWQVTDARFYRPYRLSSKQKGPA